MPPGRPPPSQKKPPRLVVPGGYAAQPSAHGAWLFFTCADRVGVWRRGAEGGDAQRVIDDMPAAEWAKWHVTAHGIFRVAMRGDTPGPRIIAALDQLAWPGISVTPDGRELLDARWDRRQRRIMLLESSRRVRSRPRQS